MSTNCLVTKFKGSTNNPNLPIYNTIAVNVKEVANPTSSTQWVLAEGQGVSIEVPSGYPMTDTTHFANGTYKAIIRNKYSISGKLGFGSSSTIDINQLNGCAGIISIQGETIWNGDIKNLASLINLTQARLANSPELIGDISVFANLTNLQDLNISNCSGISGNISAFANLTSLTSLNFARCGNIEGNYESLGNLTQLTNLPTITGTNIHGSFDEFVSRQVAAGRTTYAARTSSVGSLLTNCTFGGKTRTSGSDWTWPSWDGANKVVVYIGASNYQNCLTIYEKGATAEEIAAWNAAGKTVTDVLTDTVYPPTNQ